MTSREELDIQRTREDARADAILIAPFIANLDADKPGMFRASRAALEALAKASKTDNGHERLMFTAVNSAIEATAVQLNPSPSKQGLTKDSAEQIDKGATKVPPKPASAQPSYEPLKDAVVYVQVLQDDHQQLEVAKEIVASLRENGVIAPGIEKLDADKMPEKTQVRYFTDSDKAIAETLAAIVGKKTNSAIYIAKPNLKAKSGTLELWLVKPKSNP
jgi:hypothetical protein